MRKQLRHLRAPIVVVAATAMVALAPATAMAADPNPLDDTVNSVQKQLQSGTDGASASNDGASGSNDGASGSNASPPRVTGAAPSVDAPVPPSSDDDSTGHETENPKAPDHGAAKNLDVDVADNDAVDVGGNNATVNDDDSTNADSTLLALGGEEIIGAHADSDGPTEDSAGDPLAPLCEGSEGAICARLLYSKASATDDGTTSESKSESGIADVCLGGDSADPDAECTGPIGAEVATSEGVASRDQASGQTTASSESDTAVLCIARDEAGACALGAGLLKSEGQADSGNSPSSASRSSSFLDLVLGGEEVADTSDPQAISFPALPA